MLVRKKILFTVITSLHFVCSLMAQTTPPERTWYYNDNGIKTTVKERWDEDTQGLKHGTYIKYFSNGEREILGYYTHNKKSGQWEITSTYEVFLSTFKYIEYINYLNDEANGLYKKINVSSGTIIVIQGNYTNGLETGYWKEGYDNTNQIYSEGNYVNGKREGEWKNTNAKPMEFLSGIKWGVGDGFVSGTETKKGYRSIFKNGEAIAVYDDKGIELIAKAKVDAKNAEDEKIHSLQIEQMKSDFNTAMGKYQQKIDYVDTSSNVYAYNYCRYYYGDITYLDTFLKKYPNANQEYINEAKIAIEAKPENDAFCSATNIYGCLQYEKNFPDGIHISMVRKTLKKLVMDNLNTLQKEIPSKCFAYGNINGAIVNCELILRYKDNIDKSYYYPTLIYYSLALWSMGEKDKAVDILKPAWNATIDYSNESVKFKENYFSMYNQYKTQLHIDTDKETYKKIKAL